MYCLYKEAPLFYILKVYQVFYFVQSKAYVLTNFKATVQLTNRELFSIYAIHNYLPFYLAKSMNPQYLLLYQNIVRQPYLSVEPLGIFRFDMNVFCFSNPTLSWYVQLTIGIHEQQICEDTFRILFSSSRFLYKNRRDARKYYAHLYSFRLFIVFRGKLVLHENGNA